MTHRGVSRMMAIGELIGEEDSQDASVVKPLRDREVIMPEAAADSADAD